jgi:cardiolipin synthase
MHCRPAIALALVAMTLGCYPALPYRFGDRPDGPAEIITALTVATDHATVDGNRVVLLENGDGSFPAMLEAIGGATSSVHLETFIFSDDEIGGRFVAALEARARAGVTVRLLLDAIGSADFGAANERRLEAAGAHVEFVKPIKLNALRRAHLRTHRKILIVDGRTAFTGGICIDDDWQGNADRPDRWRETQIRVDGPVVRQMQVAFARAWFESTGDLLSERDLYPHIDPQGAVLCQLADITPEGLNRTARLLFLIALEGARHGIDITNSYFVPDRAIQRALVRAARRGVRVRLLLAGRNTDSGVVRHAGRRYYEDLLEAGVEIYEFQPAQLHAKTFVVDGAWATVGSTNLDRRSLAWNSESNLNVFDAGFAAEMEAMFERDLERSHRLTREEWRRRPLAERWREFFYGLADWQY